MQLQLKYIAAATGSGLSTACTAYKQARFKVTEENAAMNKANNESEASKNTTVSSPKKNGIAGRKRKIADADDEDESNGKLKPGRRPKNKKVVSENSTESQQSLGNMAKEHHDDAIHAEKDEADDNSDHSLRLKKEEEEEEEENDILNSNWVEQRIIGSMAGCYVVASGYFYSRAKCLWR